MKVLVTGGAGFIGSNLCEYLLSNNYEVVCLDNFSTGKIENIHHLLNTYPNTFKLIVGDIRNLADCQKALNRVDYVMHEAALGSVPRSIKDPITTNAVNIGGFLNMLIAARDAKVKRFIYAASSSTYGDSKELPKVEDIIGKPLSPYAITKYVDELYADIFARTYGLEYIGLRYFNVFGRRQDPFGAYAAVIPLFVKKMMAHERPIINGDGEISRDFTYIDDVTSAITAVLEQDIDKNYSIYNVGSSNPHSVITLLHTIEHKLGIKANYISSKALEGDVKYTCASTDLIRKNYTLPPATNFSEGISLFCKWIKEYLF